MSSKGDNKVTIEENQKLCIQKSKSLFCLNAGGAEKVERQEEQKHIVLSYCCVCLPKTYLAKATNELKN
jgi:hypothetical protein